MLDRIHVRSAVHGVVPHTLVQALCAYLRAQGWTHPLRPHGLEEFSPDHLARVSAEAYCQFLIQAATALKTHSWGCTWARLCSPCIWGTGLFTARMRQPGRRPGPHTALSPPAARHQPHRPAPHRDPTGVALGCDHGRPGALFDETGVTAIVQFARDLCGRALPLTEVDFVNPPSRRQALREAFLDAGCALLNP